MFLNEQTFTSGSSAVWLQLSKTYSEIYFRRLDEIMKLMNEFQIYFCDLGEFKRPTVNNSLNQSVRLFAFWIIFLKKSTYTLSQYSKSAINQKSNESKKWQRPE